MGARIGIDFGARSARLAWRPNSAESLLPLGGEIAIAEAAGWREGTDTRPLVPFPALKSALFDGVDLHIEGRRIDPQETTRRIFAYLYKCAERLAEEPVEACVAALPARTSSQAREHFRQAALAGGFPAVELLNEATAVILYHAPSPSSTQNILVYSLGENGLQVLLALNRPGSLQSLATASAVDISGRRFTQRLAGLLAEQIHRYGGPSLNPRAAASRLWLHAEQAKLHLSNKDSFTLFDPDLDTSGRWSGREITLERVDFEALIAEDVQRSLELCRQALLEAGLSGPREIDQLWLEGGSTRIPLIRSTLERWWERPPLPAHDNAVAFGAALQARRMDTPAPRQNSGDEIQPQSAPPAQPSGSPLQQLAARRSADLQVFQPSSSENPARRLAAELAELEPLLQAQQLDQAILRLEELQRRMQEWTADLYYQRGQQHEQAGRGEKAVADYRRAIDIDPQHPQAPSLIYSQEARMAYKQALQLANDGKYSEALKKIKLAVEKSPDNSGYRDAYAEIVLRMIDAGIRGATSGEPRHRAQVEAAVRKFGDLLVILQQAEEDLNTASRPDTRLRQINATLRTFQGSYLRLLPGKEKDAIRCLEQALEITPGQVDAQIILAEAILIDINNQLHRQKSNRGISSGSSQQLRDQLARARQLAGSDSRLLNEIHRLEKQLR